MTSIPRPSESPVFTARAALDAGVTARALRSDAFDRTFWGIRSLTAPTTLAERCRALLVRMPPGTVVSHSTAALLHGIPLPWRIERATALHLASRSPRRAPHATGIIGHQLALTDGDLSVRDGLPLTSPERTWCDLATMVHLYDLVAAGDYLIHHRSPITISARLMLAIEHRTSGRGVRLLTRALGLLDPRSESPPESTLRVILIEGGAPSVRVNHVVTDPYGEFVGRTDLTVDEWNLVLEYQGDYHRTTKGQWRADMTRRSKLEATGRRVMELNADDLRDPIELMRRIRARIAH